jgi:hypothetical protein
MVLPVFFLRNQFPCTLKLHWLLCMGQHRQQGKQDYGDDALCVCHESLLVLEFVSEIRLNNPPAGFDGG